MTTPRKALGVVAETLDSFCLKSPYAKGELLLSVLSAAGFEVLPTVLVDAVVDAANTPQRVAAWRALAAYREQVTQP